MYRKYVAIIMIIIFSVSSFMMIWGEQREAEDIIQGNEILIENVSETVITDRLLNYMQTDRSSSIPVTVQINDNIDLEKIEELAMKNCNYTTEKIKELEEYATTLSEEENIQYQQQILEIYDKIRSEKNNILKKYYSKLNKEFVEEMGWSESDYDSIGMYTPFVRCVNMSAEEIYSLAESGRVNMIDYAGNIDCTSGSDYADETKLDENGVECSSTNDTIAIIRGNVAVNNGYRGSGVRVGTIESSLPSTSMMAEYGANISYAMSGPFSEHASIVCTIIKKMAPDCNIYAFSLTGYNQTGDKFIKACQMLIDNYNVHVINASWGDGSGTGTYCAESVELDNLIRNCDVTIVAATGNDYDEVSKQAVAPNVIAVGVVQSLGTSQSADGAYIALDKSNSIETIDDLTKAKVINKPDVCAPGAIYMYNTVAAMTSYAAPHVTGTIVQMISRNSGMANKPTVLKAALMASASYSVKNHANEYAGVLFSNKHGAGVIDAGFCYDVAKNGRRTHFDISMSTQECTYDVYCDTTSSLFRVACAWEVVSTKYDTSKGTVSCNNYDMYLYKDGEEVAKSTATSFSTEKKNTNYEIIELSPELLAENGAGYYQVKIKREGNAQTSGTITLGLVWEQP